MFCRLNINDDRMKIIEIFATCRYANDFQKDFTKQNYEKRYKAIFTKQVKSLPPPPPF